MRIQFLAQLAEGDALDEHDFSHQHIAARQLVQQLQRIDSARNFIISRLDGRIGTGEFTQKSEQARFDAHAGGANRLRRAPQTAAGRNLKFNAVAGQGQRRSDVPIQRAAGCCAEHDSRHAQIKQEFQEL